MSDKSTNLIMKLLAAAGVMTFLYPALYILKVLAIGDNWEIKGVVFVFLCAAAGFSAGATPVGKHSALRFLSAVIPAALVLVLFNEDTSQNIVFEMVASSAFYLVGLSAFLTDFNEMLSESRINLGAAVIIVVNIIAYSIKKSEHFLILGFVFMVISLVIMNQANVERVFNKGTDRHMPKVSGKVRSLNLMLIAALSGAVVLAFCLKQLLPAIPKTVNIASDTASRAWRFINGKLEIGTNRYKPPAMNRLHRTNGSTLGRIILIVLFLLVLAVVIYLLYRLCRYIYGVLNKKGREFLEESDDYTDKVEQLAHKNRMGTHKKGKDGREARSVKRLRTISDPVKKIRYIYGIIIDRMLEKKLEIRKSDTTAQILNKSAKISDMDLYMGEITSIYDGVRYGDRIPDDKEIASAEHNLDETVKLLR